MAKEIYTAEKMIQTLRRTKGMVYLAAEALGCHPQTVYNYIERHPTVKAAFEAESGKILDIGEMKLYEAVLSGDAWGVQFLLKTKGKNRGYVERQEQTGKDGGPVQVEDVTPAKEYITKRLATIASRKAEGHGANGSGRIVSG